MNGIRLDGNRAYNNEKKPVPGCLGRMVDLFDLTPGASRNKLLTDKPHRDGPPLARSQSDVSRLSCPISKEIEDKMTISEVRRSSSHKKSEGTPVKLLIAQEMSVDSEMKQSSPNVVAKLMGLDTVPQQELINFSHGSSHSKCRVRDSYSEIPTGYWHHEGNIWGVETHCGIQQCSEQCKFKDIYEILEPAQRTNSQGDVSPCKGRCNSDSSDERKMALIRQKFMEVKRLSTNENLRQTKEFQDALEVLSSNQDLFVKVLQEPNSLISHHSYERQPIHPSRATKRITVLRPSKLVVGDAFPAIGKNRAKNVKKQVQVAQSNWRKNENGVSPGTSTCEIIDSVPTRIVVLKPSSGKFPDGNTVFPSTALPRNLHKANLFEVPEDDQVQEAMEVAKEVTQKMRENLASHRRGETLLSSVFSNGYIGDESSFNKSEAEFMMGNLSDLEVMSPPSRHSWDYVNQCGSPYSSSSVSHTSFAPESSVCKEAKKRLSERWAMMASNGASGEPKHVRRSSSTLGEMLALFEIKEHDRDEVENCNEDQNPRASTSCLVSNTGQREDESPRGLLRSNSLPIAATSISEKPNVEGDKRVGETNSLKEASKSTSRSAFRGKVASLFFSKSRKPSKEMLHNCQSKDEAQLDCSDFSNCHGCEEILHRLQSANQSDLREPNQELAFSLQGDSAMSKPATARNLVERQDQPSPISALKLPFEENGNATLSGSMSSYPDQLGKQTPFCLGKSNLIDKSPPIGSIARTLSWDRPSTETAISHPLKSSFLSPRGGDLDEAEWLFLVQSLLSLANLEDESQLISNLTRWHSPNSPLDPLLREKYIDLNMKGTLVEARGNLRSKRKLVFDCVNAVLVDITGLGSNLPCSVGCSVVPSKMRPVLADRVCERVKEWLSLSHRDGGDMRGFYGEGGDGDQNSLVVERVVRKDLTGRRWADLIRSEIDEIGREIEVQLLEELVEDSVNEWTR